MSETVSTKALPEILFKLIQTEKVYVKEDDGIIKLVPVEEKGIGCPLRGMFSGNGAIVDEFIANKKIEKGLEQ
jgi:hypothetical protein